MQDGDDPRLAPKAAAMASEHGRDAIVLARMLAWSRDDPQHSTFWEGVLALLLEMEEEGRL